MPNYTLRAVILFRGQVDSYSRRVFTFISLFNLCLNYIYLSYINRIIDPLRPSIAISHLTSYWTPLDFNLLFWDHTVQLRHSQRTHTHTPMNTRMQTLPLWASSKTEPANSWDWRSHHRRLAIEENVAYHLIHNAVKSQNIHFYRESNQRPHVLPRLL